MATVVSTPASRTALCKPSEALSGFQTAPPSKCARHAVASSWTREPKSRRQVIDWVPLVHSKLLSIALPGLSPDNDDAGNPSPLSDPNEEKVTSLPPSRSESLPNTSNQVPGMEISAMSCPRRPL